MKDYECFCELLFMFKLLSIFKTKLARMLQKSKDFINKEIKEFSEKQTIELQELIKYHSDLYYNKEEPIISDFEYDILLEKLQELETKFNITNTI
jgi:DNA ligase (NAD+)